MTAYTANISLVRTLSFSSWQQRQWQGKPAYDWNAHWFGSLDCLGKTENEQITLSAFNNYCQWATELDILHYTTTSLSHIDLSLPQNPSARQASGFMHYPWPPQECESLLVKELGSSCSRWGMGFPNTAMLSPSDTLDNRNILTVTFGSPMRICSALGGKKSKHQVKLPSEQHQKINDGLTLVKLNFKTVTLYAKDTNSINFKVIGC